MSVFCINDNGGTPELVSLDQVKSKENLTCNYFMPKKTVNTKLNEMVRVIRLQKTIADYIAVRLPRKAGAFSEDLYPPCYAGQEMMKYDEWANGKDVDPALAPFDPDADGVSPAALQRQSTFKKKVEDAPPVNNFV